MSLDGDDTESETTWVDDMEYVDKKAFTINTSMTEPIVLENHKEPSKSYKFEKKKG